MEDYVDDEWELGEHEWGSGEWGSGQPEWGSGEDDWADAGAERATPECDRRTSFPKHDVWVKRAAFLAEYEFLGFEKQETERLLHYLRYTPRKITEYLTFDQKKQEQLKQRAGLLCAPQVAGQSGMCPICFEKAEGRSTVCGHEVCDTCWGLYLNGEFKQKNLLATCPALGENGKRCQVFVTPSLLETFLSPSNLILFNTWILEDYISCSVSLRMCTCGWVLQGSGQEDIECTHCHRFSCFACGELAHLPCPCDLLRRWKSMLLDPEAASERLISAITKPCPKCKTRIEKNKACNHIKCTTCRHDFCWQCLGPMVIGTDHPSWYDCKRTVSDSIEMERKAVVRLGTKLKFHEKQFGEQKRLQETVRLMRGPSRPSWLVRVLSSLEKALNFAAYCYVYSFFLKNGSAKDSFVYLQDCLRDQLFNVSRQLTKAVRANESVEPFTFSLALKGKCEQMAERVSDHLLFSPDTTSRYWACVRCEMEWPTTLGICLKCKACQVHGDLDCLVKTCI